MKILDVLGGTGASAIRVGDSLESLAGMVTAERAVIITDSNVRRLYGERFPDWEIIEIGTGESVKTLDTVREIYGKLIGLSADRSTFIVGIGGGLVCDVAGYVASTYMRGLDFGFVSTTLLSQVDASVGGKNGVNYEGYKNMVGTFNQPKFVICDMEMLQTLSEEEVLSGFGEVVKHALIADVDMFTFLERSWEAALSLDPETIEKLGYESVVIKAGVVSRDELEKGERRKLNFGHTFGHAFEKAAKIPHGMAVSAGMVAAAELSVRRGTLAAADAARIKALLTKMKLPVKLSLDPQKVVDGLAKDKKRSGDTIHFVLLSGIGEAFVEEVSLREIEAVTGDLCGA